MTRSAVRLARRSIAPIYGNLLLDESITLAMVGGMALILVGVFLIARGRRSQTAVGGVATGAGETVTRD